MTLNEEDVKILGGQTFFQVYIFGVKCFVAPKKCWVLKILGSTLIEGQQTLGVKIFGDPTKILGWQSLGFKMLRVKLD